MATNNISLNSSVRDILLTLQKTTSDMEITQNRLATGKKVNSALDNPSAFFTSQSLYNRASDLSNLKDGISNAMSVIKASSEGLTGIEKMLTQMKSTAEQAIAAKTVAERTKYSDQYDNLRTEITNLATDSSFNGVNLIKATPDSIDVVFNEDGSSKYTIAGVASDAAGLEITVANAWDDADLDDGKANIEGDLALINAALTTVRATQTTLGTSTSLLKIRSDFTSNMINTLNIGGDTLTNANMNEESANLLTLQTRQALAVSSLSMANQSQQSVLRLFG